MKVNINVTNNDGELESAVVNMSKEEAEFFINHGVNDLLIRGAATLIVNGQVISGAPEEEEENELSEIPDEYFHKA